MTKEEIWQDIAGFEGVYQVSNFGKVRSLDRMIPRCNSAPYFLKGRTLKAGVNPNGYAFVCLRNRELIKLVRIHRLVAETFIANPHEYPVVNHKDENKLNNNVGNLEWCTYSYNTTYNNSMRTKIDTRNKNNSHGCEKEVYQYDLEGNLIKVWPSLMSVTRKQHVSYANISKCCRGGKYRHTAYGYKWSYKPIDEK